LEIGSNDGTLLNEFKQIGLSAVGIEPSLELVNDCIAKDLRVFHGFANSQVLKSVTEIHGNPSIVVANNVFAHIPDLIELFSDISGEITEDGIVIFEVAHVLKMFEKVYFDTIYHEHMSFHSVFSLEIFLRRFGLFIFKVQEIPTHGGSIRVFAAKSLEIHPKDLSVEKVIRKELDYGIKDVNSLARFRNDIADHVLKVKSTLLPLIEGENKFIFGYGAPAKIVTFLSEMGLEKLPIEFIVDDNSKKQNHFLPRSGFKIVSFNELLTKMSVNSEKEAICLVFPWNINEELILKLTTLELADFKVVSFFPTIEIRRV
jgi:hypothetical protein